MVELNREFLVKKYGKDNLINLNEIDISCYQIRKIDTNTFKGLTKLEILYLNINKIEEIDVKLFESLSNLKWLSLIKNKMKRIDSNTFKGLTKLQLLLLSNNEIEKIDVRLFESLSNLKILSLLDNKLKRIDSNTFKDLTNLEDLYLASNEIEEIDVRLFEGLSNLKKLWLDNNKLKEIDRKCFEPLKLIEVILICENVGLNALSFIKPLAKIEWYDNYKVEKYGSISEWNEFLQQFPRLEKRQEQEAKEKEEKEKQKIEEENKRKEKQEKENVKRPSSSESSNLSETNKEKRQEQEAKEKEEKERQQVFNRLKIEEENKIIAKKEQENVKRPSSSNSSNLSAPKKEIDKEIQDPYIGLLLSERYEIKRSLGKGAFGAVYLVDDTKIDNKIVKEKAMKIMDELDSVTENELDLFIKINHENIVRYFDHFHKSIGGQHKTFLITEFCENGDLRKKIQETKRLGKSFDDIQILDWISQSTNALKYLHSRKPEPIIHRDIKPENMLLNGVNEIKLGDLGLSKLMNKTHASSYAGTPLYMSPEVFKSQFIDTVYYPNTDIWSLGCVLYELKFLNFAFPLGQRNSPPIPAEISSSGIFSSILPKMLEKDCLKRITSQRLFNELLNLSDAN